MALLYQPVEVTDHRGVKRIASALHVDFETSRVFVRFHEPFENTAAWIDLERVRMLDAYDPQGYGEAQESAAAVMA